jgi:hypothetical protein
MWMEAFTSGPCERLFSVWGCSLLNSGSGAAKQHFLDSPWETQKMQVKLKKPTEAEKPRDSVSPQSVGTDT